MNGPKIREAYKFRITRSLILKEIFINDSSCFPYAIDLVGTKKILNEILKIASFVSFDDRFSKGNKLTLENATKRNLFFIKNAFSKKDEFVLYFYNRQNNNILGYQTGKFINKTEALLFLSGRLINYNSRNYHELLDLLFHKWLIEAGIKFILAVSSSVNLNELNLSFQSQGFHVENTTVTMQKWFS